MCKEANELKQRMAADLVEEGLSYVELCERYTDEEERSDMEKYVPEILSVMDELLAKVDTIHNALLEEIEELE